MSGGNSERKGVQLRLTERRSKALQLSIAGWSYREIAAEIDVSHTQVGNYIRQALEKTTDLSASQTAELRQIQFERIEGAIKKVWAKIAAGRDLLSAVQTLIRLLEREAKLMGLDAPTKVDISAKVRAMAVEEGFDPDDAIEMAFKEIKAGE